MEKVITIMHDTRVYEAMRRQAKFNRRMTLFAMAVTFYIFTEKYILYKEHQKTENPREE